MFEAQTEYLNLQIIFYSKIKKLNKNANRDIKKIYKT